MREDEFRTQQIEWDKKSLDKRVKRCQPAITKLEIRKRKISPRFYLPTS